MDENEVLEGLRKAIQDALAGGIKKEAILGLLHETLGEEPKPEEPKKPEDEDEADKKEAEGAYGYPFKD